MRADARGRRRGERSAARDEPRRRRADRGRDRRRERERVVVTVGGVASTDGGVGAVEALGGRLAVPLEVACDVDARFLEAADVFAPQKGATPEQVALLRERLARLDVPDQPGAGAAGGLAGGLAAIGATLVRGFDLVARPRSTSTATSPEADLVITGEGLVDATSLTGKVVGGVLARAASAGVRVARRRRRRRDERTHRRRISRGTLWPRASPRRPRRVPRGGRREGAPASTENRLDSHRAKAGQRTASHLPPGSRRASSPCGRRRLPLPRETARLRRRAWLPGGFLGVDLFFVLSGYLITSILLVEWEHHRRIDLLRFWRRRARRLFPAVVVVVLAALAARRRSSRATDLAQTRSDAISSLFYFTTGTRSSRTSSYFDVMGSRRCCKHFWSLAVEEQFYIVWPLLLVPGLIFLGRRRLPAGRDRGHRRLGRD